MPKEYSERSRTCLGAPEPFTKDQFKCQEEPKTKIMVGTSAPSLDGATVWLNDYTTSPKIQGESLLLQFWAVSCPICKINMPNVQRIRDEYAHHGLQIISIHMPRGESDLDIDRVRQAMQEMNMTEPCAIDNDHAIGDRFDTGGMWPYYFLFDADGKLRSKAAGPTGLKMVESALKRMLARQEGVDVPAATPESVTA